MITNARAKRWCSHPAEAREDQMSHGGEKVAEICRRCFLVFPVDEVSPERPPKQKDDWSEIPCDHREAFPVSGELGHLADKCPECGRIRVAGSEKWKLR